jgi:hypothetical protein
MAWETATKERTFDGGLMRTNPVRTMVTFPDPLCAINGKLIVGVAKWEL